MSVILNPFTGNFQIGSSSGGGGGGGTVTSVGLALPSIFNVTVSPVTGSGNLTAVLNSQAANSVFAGPISGSNAIPTFRPLNISDIPSGIAEQVELFTLISTDISNGYVTLASMPTSSSYVVLLIQTAPNQFYGIDYTVIGSKLSWTGLALDGILSIGDNLTVLYS